MTGTSIGWAVRILARVLGDGMREEEAGLGDAPLRDSSVRPCIALVKKLDGVRKGAWASRRAFRIY